MIPVVDLRDARAPAAIDDACREIGFFQIVGHGLDARVEATAWRSALDFFRLPLADKLALAIPDGAAPEPGQLRAGAHSDYGTLTLLRQDAVGGLQVRDVMGEWHDVPGIDGAYVVNVGDALERWTNDAWRSTLHRVVVRPGEAGNERHSLAFFHNANWDAVIEAIPTCVAPGAQPRHVPVGAGRHLMDKFRSTQS